MELRRRRRRNRSGRYQLEFEVEWRPKAMEANPEPAVRRLWLNLDDYEAMWERRRIGDDARGEVV